MSEEKKTFNISKENHKAISQLKLDIDLPGMDEVLDYLFKKAKIDKKKLINRGT